jgi:hypothetical protein
MPILTRTADRFQRALDGQSVDDADLAELVGTAHRLVDLGRPAPGPDPEFVVRLRDRLMAEAATMPAPSQGAARQAARVRAEDRGAPVLVLVGRGMPRLVAGAAASALLVGGVVGVVSRSAVPGDALYPVKGWIDGVAVRLADDDLSRGQTYLAQAQEHISDARTLAGRPNRADAAGDINIALQAAIDSVRNGQRSLDASYTRTGNQQALLALRDFTARALPQVQALRSEAPPASQVWVGRLEALLVDTQQATARRIAACGAACSSLAATTNPASLPGSVLPGGVAGQPSPTSTAGRPTASGSRSSAGPVPTTGLPAPSGAAGGSSSPSLSAGTGGVVVGGPGGGATLSTGGATIKLPSVSVPLPLPSTTSSSSSGVSVPLPSATLGTGGVTATVPSATLGPITLPGTTVTLP